MTTRTRYTATFLYPGVFMPETIAKDIAYRDLTSALAEQPDEKKGYFKRDGWYAVEIKAITEKEFFSSDGESTYVTGEVEKVGTWIVGERIHYTDIPDTPENQNLISGLRTTESGYGVRTRLGNWQPADYYTHIASPTQVAAAASAMVPKATSGTAASI